MNNLTRTLKIRYPIIQGGMGNISNSILAAAVSNAGGLGTIGAGTMNPEEIEKIILETKELTKKPFAVNVALSVSPYVKEILGLAVKHSVAAVSLSAGNPAPFIHKLHEHGIKVITVVASVKQAIKAETAGADVLVAEGYEAAGINSPNETTTLTLIPQIARAVSVPVAAAGGIADGLGLAAMLVLGASAVQMGTRFIATQEAPFHDSYKQKILEASDTDTIIVGRSVGRIRRVINTPYATKLLEAENQGISLEAFNELTAEDNHKIGALLGDGENGFMNSGQISGYIQDLPTVSELLQKMMLDAEITLQKTTEIFKKER
ncbi:nitronate monooxygenase [Neobacillus sp. PS3-34]|uniref:NAD(P)H-dependent flavin oxidoreductase n=1 Tax=Neobacillus sp. PS3-34 TaxID=3070678 RepID=UPI0027E158D7|nr:nitronate monooxygenase [Neobacillus sp. PS3-34]WML48139.1 nitronate monooxygenase [Neobacillus sp. PS3-34]